MVSASAAAADAVIIGGGSTGTSAAFHLARRGAGKVFLIERAAVGSGPTGKSIGIIRLHYSYEPLIRLAARSLAFFSRFEEITGGTADFTRAGFLLLAAPEQMETVRANVELQRSLGVRTSILTPSEVAALEPRMHVADAGGAAYEPDSGFADGYATAASFAAAARRLGAEVWEGTAVERLVVEGRRVVAVETSRGTVATPRVLVAAGPWTPRLLEPAGVRVPIEATRQQVIHLAPPPAFGPLTVVLEDMIQAFYARPEAGGTALAGVLEEETQEVVSPDAFNQGADWDFVERVGQRWQRRFPGGADAAVQGGYASLYDVTPDWQPVLGPVDEIDGLYVAAGFSGHGFKLSPALGEALAAEMTGERPEIDISAFHLSRFATGALIWGRHQYGILG